MATGTEGAAGATGNELLSVGQPVDIELKQNAATVALQSCNKSFRQAKSLLERLVRNTSFGYSARKRFGGCQVARMLQLLVWLVRSGWICGKIFKRGTGLSQVFPAGIA